MGSSTLDTEELACLITVEPYALSQNIRSAGIRKL